MKTKLYFLVSLFAFLFWKSQTPELLYYKFEGTGNLVPNLASAPPAGTANAELISLTQGGSTACMGGSLIGSGIISTTNYLDTKWPMALSNSWTMHFKVNNFVNDNTTLYYLLGDSGSSFRLFTNGAAGANNLRLSGTGMTTLNINGVFPATSPVDIIISYDSSLQNIKTYVNGILNTTTAQTSALNLNGTLFKVGGYGSNIGLKAGMLLDEFGLFNRVLTASEIQSLNTFCQLLSTSENVAGNGNDKIYIKDKTINLIKGSFGEYAIYDATGRQILKGNEKSNSIDISSLKSSIYFVVFNGRSVKIKVN